MLDWNVLSLTGRNRIGRDGTGLDGHKIHSVHWTGLNLTGVHVSGMDWTGLSRRVLRKIEPAGTALHWTVVA